LPQSPNLLWTAQIASNRTETANTANKKLNRLSSQNYPNSFSENAKGRTRLQVLPNQFQSELNLSRGRRCAGDGSGGAGDLCA